MKNSIFILQLSGNMGPSELEGLVSNGAAIC